MRTESNPPGTRPGAQSHSDVKVRMLRRMRDRPEGIGRMNTKTLARHRRRVEGKV